ncbi:putative Ufm1-specific protease 2 [Blattella germanica]|nr:putative Ufm1-specific protease 2 [Blattella germanica]
MTPRLKISTNVLDRLNAVSTGNSGFLFGLMYDGALLVVGLSLQLEAEVDGEETEDQERSCSESKLHFPTEVDLCGFVAFDDVEFTPEFLENVQQDVHITDNPVLLRYHGGVKAQLFVNSNLKDVSYEVKAGSVCFHFPKSSIYLMSSDAENNGLSGLTGDPTVGELCDICMASESSDKIIEGCGKLRGKKKSSAKEVDVLSVDMLVKSTRDIHLEPPSKCAPVIHHVKRSYICLQSQLHVDALAMVHRSTKVVRLYAVLVDSLCRNLKLMENSFLDQVLDSTVSMPESFHFLPPECGHFVTVVYPKKRKDADLMEERRLLHRLLALPQDRPFFRRGCAHLFAEDIPPNSPLINVHEGLSSTVKDGEVSLVQGTYSYHHYRQDRMDDSGWGCAYRSLQTIVSWFRWQGYTDHAVPSHREIQQCLVNIGDKPSSFVGSCQWIGSTEVSFCLESMLGLPSRIISVSSGEELGYKGGELAHHFKHVGTPIMIGGGVYAHTILGVDFNKNSGELKFLILDPHYTGTEDLGIIQSKGWCGWKGVDFWNKTAYYNLCLPQRPRCV